MSNAERIVEVNSTRSREGAFQVFNVEVDGLHTYQVSDLAILVHNKPVNLAGRAISAEVLTAMRAQAERVPKGTSRDDRLRALDSSIKRQTPWCFGLKGPLHQPRAG